MSRNGVTPAIRKKSLVQSIFLVSLLLMEHQDQFVPVKLCEVQLSLGQLARNSTEPTNQSWSNQLLLIILGSCNQGFDLKSVVVQTLCGLQRAPLPVWHDQCNWAQYNTSKLNDNVIYCLDQVGMLFLSELSRQ